MGNDKPSIKDLSNRLYGSFYKLNMKLLKKSEKKAAKLSCADIFDFYITSNALSFLKDIYFDLYRSLGFVMNARCILEGLALKYYCSDKDDPLLSELLKKQRAILEYKCYNSFDGIKELIVAPEKIEADYQDAVQFYRDTLSANRHLSDASIRRIIDSQIPFICDPYTNYRKLIGEQLGEDYAKLYGLLSQMVHPSLNDTFLNNDLLKSTGFVFELLISEYSEIQNSQHDLEYYCNISMSTPVPLRLQQLAKNEYDKLNSIADAFNSLGENRFISHSLRTIAIIRTEMMIDTVLGLREQTKSKWKILLDLYAVFFEVVIVKKCDSGLMELLRLHNQTQFERNIKLDYDTNEAYSLYISIYPSGVEKDSFDKTFNNVTGYLINVRGQCPSLSKLVRDFSSHFDKNPENSVQYEINYMNYLESQLLSHANGYLWFANSGAWNDVYGLINSSNFGLLLLLNGILEGLKPTVNDQSRKALKPIVNLLRNAIKDISQSAAEEAQLLLIPTVGINNLQ